GRRLPLLGLDPEAADQDLLASRLAARPAARPPAEPRAPPAPRLDPPGGADLHPPPLGPALVDAPAPLLGLPAGGRHHLPPGLRLDLLRQRRAGPDDLRHLPLRLPDRLLPPPHGLGVAALPRARYRGGPGARRHRALPLAPHARPRRAGGAGLRARFFPPHPALRHLGDRARLDRLDALAAGELLRAPVDP